jgi:S-adenosylmethionine uptake transporter
MEWVAWYFINLRAMGEKNANREPGEYDGAMTPQPKLDEPAKALTWMACSALAFSVMAIFVKRLGSEVPASEQIFWRAALNFIFVFLLMWVRRENFFPPVLRSRKIHRLLFFRGLAGLGGVTCLFYSIHHQPLPIAMMLGWCSPLFVLLFSRVFLREQLSRLSFASIGLAFVGLYYLLRPAEASGAAGYAVINTGAVAVGLLGAAFSGAAYVAVRAATASVGANFIVLYFMGVSMVFSAPFAVAEFRMPSRENALRLLLMGVMATIGQVTMTQAYRFAPASIVSTMSLLNAAFSAFFGWWIFNERLGGTQTFGLLILGLSIASLTVASRVCGTGCNPR